MLLRKLLPILFFTVTFAYSKYDIINEGDKKKYFGDNVSAEKIDQYKEIARQFEEIYVRDMFGSQDFFTSPSRKKFSDVVQHIPFLKNEKRANEIFNFMKGGYYIYLIHSSEDEAKLIAPCFESFLDSILMGSFGLSKKKGNQQHKEMITDYLLHKRLNRLENGKSSENLENFKMLPKELRTPSNESHLGMIQATALLIADNFKVRSSDSSSQLIGLVKSFEENNHLKELYNSFKSLEIKKNPITSYINDFNKKNMRDIWVFSYLNNPQSFQDDCKKDLIDLYPDKNIMENYRYHAIAMIKRFYENRDLLNGITFYFGKQGGYIIDFNYSDKTVFCNDGTISENVKDQLNNEFPFDYLLESKAKELLIKNTKTNQEFAIQRDELTKKINLKPKQTQEEALVEELKKENFSFTLTQLNEKKYFNQTTQLLEQHELQDYIAASIEFLNKKYYFKAANVYGNKLYKKYEREKIYLENGKVAGYENNKIDNAYVYLERLFTDPAKKKELEQEVQKKAKKFTEDFFAQFISSYYFAKEIGSLKSFLERIKNNGCVNARLGGALGFENDFLETIASAQSFASKLYTILPDQLRDKKDYSWITLKNKALEIYNLCSDKVQFKEEDLLKELKKQVNNVFWYDEEIKDGDPAFY